MTTPYEEFDEADAEVAASGRNLPYTKTDTGVLPDAMIPDLTEEKLNELRSWLDIWYQDLFSAHQEKIDQWAEEERSYRAKYEGDLSFPFIGASGITVPLIAMGVDPVYARLDTGMFRGDRVFVLKALKKSMVDIVPNLEKWLHYVVKNKLKLRQHVGPRLLEFCKHGTMVLKTCYEYENRKIKGYAEGSYEVVDRQIETAGARIFGVSLNDFMFPPRYQHFQDAPICMERIRYTPGRLRALAKSKKFVNVEDVIKFKTPNVAITALEAAREAGAKHRESGFGNRNEIDDIWEIYCDYDIDGDGLEEKLCITYHIPSRTFLQLRFNWYFHQQKPYVVVPYITTNDSLYGMGLAEMIHVFQVMLTKWERMAENNAYLANTRMFVGRDGTIKEDALRVYCARVVKVQDPSTDLLSLPIADVYQSTLTERQNIIGLGEKRTGISDYLTGRESPIVGSRATATSTLALIQEGTRRVEQVLENIRNGLSEAIMMCFSLWIQFGVDPVTDIAFDGDEVAEAVHKFFNTVDKDNIDGAIGVDLSAIDAANNKQAQQQAQLALIQIMMQYLQKVIELGQSAIQMQNPVFNEMASEVVKAARQMFRDLLSKYDIPNAEMYLPDLEAAINATAPAPVGPGGDVIGSIGAAGQPGMGALPSGGGAALPVAADRAGAGNGRTSAVPLAGSGRRA